MKLFVRDALRKIDAMNLLVVVAATCADVQKMPSLLTWQVNCSSFGSLNVVWKSHTTGCSATLCARTYCEFLQKATNGEIVSLSMSSSVDIISSPGPHFSRFSGGEDLLDYYFYQRIIEIMSLVNS